MAQIKELTESRVEIDSLKQSYGRLLSSVKDSLDPVMLKLELFLVQFNALRQRLRLMTEKAQACHREGSNKSP